MSLDGKIGHVAVGGAPVVTRDHPPVLLSGLIEAGGLAAAWPAGRVLARDAALKLIPWDGETGPPAGVLAEDADPAKGGAALYLAHGTAALASLTLADGSGLDAEQIYKLASAGVFGV